MKNFGEVFKQFRVSRGLKLKDVANAGISTSQLSRFEKGETDLTITKFMSILDEINTPIDEFMYVANDFHRDELNEILEQIQTKVANRDVDGMKSLLAKHLEKKQEYGKYQQINTILIKIRLQELSGEEYYTLEELSYLTDYLFSVEYWGYYELLIFINTLDVLNHELGMTLSREMMKRSSFYKEIPNNRRLISTMLLNTYIICIERDKLADALYFEEQLKLCFFKEIEIYERLIFRYAKHFYQFVSIKSQEAVTEMRKCVEMMRLVGSNQLATTYENHLKTILTKLE